MTPAAPARCARWHLPRRSLPNVPVSAAPASTPVSGLFSTDESVATRCRFQRRIARSFHGLRSPSRSTRCPLVPASRRRAEPSPASWRLPGPDARFTVVSHGGVGRAYPSGGCPTAGTRTGGAFLAVTRGTWPRRGAFSASSGGTSRAPMCRPPKRRRAPEQCLQSLFRSGSVECGSRDALRGAHPRARDQAGPRGAVHRPSWGL